MAGTIVLPRIDSNTTLLNDDSFHIGRGHSVLNNQVAGDEEMCKAQSFEGTKGTD